jgi:hypothetical protein
MPRLASELHLERAANPIGTPTSALRRPWTCWASESHTAILGRIQKLALRFSPDPVQRIGWPEFEPRGICGVDAVSHQADGRS